MATRSLIPVQSRADLISQLAGRSVVSVRSDATRRNYIREITSYLSSGLPITREAVLGHLRAILKRNSASSHNIALAAIKTLVREAQAQHLIADDIAYSIQDIPMARQPGQRCGKWITDEQLKAIITVALDRPTGTRDAALIATAYGCGLRRSELESLAWSHWQLQDGRYAWVDIIGKGGKRRTVPCSDWCARYIERWRVESGADRAEPI